jgi:DTW domain-containing protein YfiP
LPNLGKQDKFDQMRQSKTPAENSQKPKTPETTPTASKLEPEPCSKCLKQTALCLCAELPKLDSDLKVLILQHPQEPDKDLGTARLTHLALGNSTLKIGLSWANLTKALGSEAQSSKWAVLYLGSGIQGTPNSEILQFVSKKGAPVERPKDLDGIVILDGTWSQAKALWWRNPWLLKLKRCILIPKEKSLYGELRKEPRGECLSTLESVATALEVLGEDSTIKTRLTEIFKSLLGKYRGLKKTKAVLL